MSNKLLKKIILITIALIALYMPKCFAAGASIGTSTTSAKPGDTVELYIDLLTASIGYDLQISADNTGLISSSELVNKIGSGDISRIYLVQLASSSDRITHPSGTRIATIKYTIAETATPGSKITLNVAGNVAGQTSSDKNVMNENITINIVADLSTDEKTEEENPPQEEEKEEESGQENVPEDTGKGEGTVQENQPQEEDDDEEIGKENSTQENVPQEDEYDDTTAKVILPAAGVKEIAVITIIVLIIIVYSSFNKYNQNKDIK